MKDPKAQYTYTNNTATYQYPAGKAVAPGESIILTYGECPEHAPDAVKQAKPGKPAVDPIAEVLKGKVDEVKAKLPALSDETLAKLGEAEQLAKDPRKGVLGAIADEQMRRADFTSASDEERAAAAQEILAQKPKDLAKHLPTLPSVVLLAVAAEEGKATEPRSELIEAINKIVAARGE